MKSSSEEKTTERKPKAKAKGKSKAAPKGPKDEDDEGLVMKKPATKTKKKQSEYDDLFDEFRGGEEDDDGDEEGESGAEDSERSRSRKRRRTNERKDGQRRRRRSGSKDRVRFSLEFHGALGCQDKGRGGRHRGRRHGSGSDANGEARGRDACLLTSQDGSASDCMLYEGNLVPEKEGQDPPPNELSQAEDSLLGILKEDPPSLKIASKVRRPLRLQVPRRLRIPPNLKIPMRMRILLRLMIRLLIPKGLLGLNVGL